MYIYIRIYIYIYTCIIIYMYIYIYMCMLPRLDATTKVDILKKSQLATQFAIDNSGRATF